MSRLSAPALTVLCLAAAFVTLSCGREPSLRLSIDPADLALTGIVLEDLTIAERAAPPVAEARARNIARERYGYEGADVLQIALLRFTDRLSNSGACVCWVLSIRPEAVRTTMPHGARFSPIFTWAVLPVDARTGEPLSLRAGGRGQVRELDGTVIDETEAQRKYAEK